MTKDTAHYTTSFANSVLNLPQYKSWGPSCAYFLPELGNAFKVAHSAAVKEIENGADDPSLIALLHKTSKAVNIIQGKINEGKTWAISKKPLSDGNVMRSEDTRDTFLNSLDELAYTK